MWYIIIIKRLITIVCNQCLIIWENLISQMGLRVVLSFSICDSEMHVGHRLWCFGYIRSRLIFSIVSRLTYWSSDEIEIQREFFPNFPWGNYTGERNLEGRSAICWDLGIIMTFWKIGAADVQSCSSCWEAKLGGGWIVNLSSTRKTTIPLTLKSFGSICPLPNTQDTSQLWPTRFHLPTTSTRSTCIPTPLSKLQTCIFNSQFLNHKSMSPMRLRVTNAKTQHTSEFPVSITHHPLPQHSVIRPRHSVSQRVVCTVSQVFQSITKTTPRSVPTLT